MISNTESGDEKIDNLVVRIERLKEEKEKEIDDVKFWLTCPEYKPSGDHLKGRLE